MAKTQLQIVDSWVVYDQSAAMFPGMAYTADGDLLVSFSTVPDGLPGGEIHLIRSTDQGQSWSDAQVVARSERTGGAACNALGLTSLRSGTLLLPYNDIVTESNFRDRHATSHILRSVDGGSTWHCREAVAKDVYEPLLYGQVIEGSDGTLAIPVWGRLRQEERWHASLLFSNNDGRTWGERATVAFDPAARLRGAYVDSTASGFDEEGRFDPTSFQRPTFRPHAPVDGFNETSVIALPDGRLLAILRQQGVEQTRILYFYQSISEDEGRTWSPYQRTNMCGMSPCLHHTPSGQLVLAYRLCAPEDEPESTPGLGIAYSEDDGMNWVKTLTLREPKGFRYTAEYQVGYPAVVTRPDGSILVVYYSYDEALPHRRYLAANLLSETRQ